MSRKMNFPTWMHSSANLPRYIHFPNYDREIRLHSHSPARIKQASTKREKFPRPVNLYFWIKISQRCYERGERYLHPFKGSDPQYEKEKLDSTINYTNVTKIFRNTSCKALLQRTNPNISILLRLLSFPEWKAKC